MPPTIVKAMTYPVVMYGCESWAIMRAEHWRTDAFELWCWRRLLRVPWNCKIKPVHPKENQSWIFIGGTDAETKAPVVWPLDAKSRLIGKDTDAGKDWRQKRRGWQRMRWLEGITDSTVMSLSSSERYWQDWSLAGCSPWGHNTDTNEQLNNNEMVVGKKDREREVLFWFVLRTIVPHSLVTHCGNT